MPNQMKYFNQYYIGMRTDEPTASGKPLAFAVPDGNDSAAKKRKRTVDAWTMGFFSANDFAGRPRSDIKEMGEIYDNRPMTGFRLTEWNGRYITDNKVVRVLDPRGFELEIYIPNLMDLILNCKVDHGLIQDELVWLRDGAHNRLVRTADPVFDQAKQAAADGKKKKSPKVDHQPGDIVTNSWGEFLYVGLLDVEFIVPRGPRVLIEKSPYYEYHRIKKERIEGISLGRRHVYTSPRGSASPVALRKNKMTVHEVQSSNNKLPEFGEHVYFEADYDSCMYYDEYGCLHTSKEVSDLEDRANQNRHAWFHPRIRLRGSRFWETRVVRINDGPIQKSPVKSQIEKQFEYPMY